MHSKSHGTITASSHLLIMYINHDIFKTSHPHYSCTFSSPFPISSTAIFGNFKISTFLPNPGQGLPGRLLLDDEERLWAGE